MNIDAACNLTYNNDMSVLKHDREIDIRGLVCPFTFVKSKLALEDMEIGQVLMIILDCEEATVNVPKSITEQGQTVLDVQRTGDKEWVIYVRKDED